MKLKLALAASAALAFLTSCGTNYHEFSRFVMDTEVVVKIAGMPGEKAAECAALAFQEIEMLDKVFNWRNPSSRLYKLNNEGSTKTDKTLDTLIRKSLEYSKFTGGAFDVTVQPLVELWDVKNSSVPPNPGLVRATLRRVGYRNVRITKRHVRLRGGARIDLGAIAKGQAVDSAAEILRACGVRDALVNAGGNVRVIGSRTWNIGIRHPRNGRKLLGVIKLKEMSVATSGDYERFFEYRGRRYHHIFDPRTGYPAGGCISVTVVAPLAVDADALSTSLFVLGPEKGLKAVSGLNGVECIFVTSDGRIISSPGLKDVRLRF
jgi:thiamine biosynthesis lipoprotein